MHLFKKTLTLALISQISTGFLRADEGLNLDAAGENRAELHKALEQAPDEQKEGLRFLLKYMPEADLKQLSGEYLLTNLKLAYKAREEFPWGKEVPVEIFHNDVLPYASLDERRDDWRGDFYKRFGKIVKDAKTLDEACLLVNKAIKDEVKVIYSTKRNKANQSPYESMEQGLASCSGLSILLVDALRSVGIPARVAGIPSWTTKQGNHNWVEYWSPVDKQWHFIEYYPDDKGPDHAWFDADTRLAKPDSFLHSIYATSWKETGIHFPMIWDMDSKLVPGVNVTERYLTKQNPLAKDECELRIDFTNQEGARDAIDIQILQGETVVHKGKTPSRTDDMNRFLQVRVKRGQEYQLVWQEAEGATPQSKKIKPTENDSWLRVELGKSDKE